MSRKIIGVTVGTTLPKPSFDQTDPTKGDYIRGDRSFLTMDETLTQTGRPADAKAVGDEIASLQEELDSKVDKSGDTMSGNLTLEKSSPNLTLKHTTTGRQGRIAATGDNYVSIYNEDSDDSSNNKVALWLASENTAVDNLFRINHILEGESNTYKVIHSGSAEGKKLSYTNIAYGTCNTAETTAEKVVTIIGNDNWELKVGSIVVVNGTYKNTAQSPTLNVNGTGAKSIWINNAVMTTSYYGWAMYAGIPVIYMYDGTYWVWLGHAIDNNNTYSNQSLGNGYGTCSTAAATTAKVVTLSSYALVTHGMVSVKFTNAVPAGATMNINSKGAKAIYHNGAAITAGVIGAGDIATFVYDGSYYQLIAVDRTNINYTATIGTTWTGSAAPYSQTITVTGITANDKPIVDVTMSGTYATDKTRLAEWSKIYRIVTAANKITVYANAKTTASLPIQLQVVR